MDLKVFLYVRVNIKILSRKFRILILEILELYTRKVCEMFVYKLTDATECVKLAYFLRKLRTTGD